MGRRRCDLRRKAMGHRRRGRRLPAKGWGRCGWRLTTMGWGRFGRRRTAMGRGHYDGGEPLWGWGGAGGGGQESGVPGWPEPKGGGAYQSGPLSSIIDSQAPASIEQLVEWPILFVAHLPSIDKWHARSVGGGLVRPTTTGNNILIGDSADSIHRTGDLLSSTRRDPLPSTRRF